MYYPRLRLRLADVYKYALYNITATAALDGRHGCFAERNPLLVETCPVYIKSFPGESQPAGFYDLVPDKFWERSFMNAPLNTRAWVMQERFLSPRILHCGRDQLIWQCSEMFASETYPNGYLNDGWVSGYRDKVEIRTPNLDGVDKPLKVWKQLLYYYNKCNLTQQQDKLIAISGLAKAIQPLIGGDYFAGLWGQSLPNQLLWSVSRNPTVNFIPRRPDKYCAPTWSWASVIADILPAGPGTDSLAKDPEESSMIQILECQVNPVTDNVFGQLSGGHLTINGWLRS
ncbi:hypothetical protein DL95DRAFT_282279, partial [Leptodontidium sp. 2 PMI_412]